jgi:5-methylcytosine-specific restriction enzyme A
MADPTRHEFPRSVKVAAFKRAAGKCEHCTARLYVGKFHYDHRIADGLTGEPTIENCAVLCIACHGEKTTKHDVPTIARAKRREAKHIGAKPKSSHRWPKRPFAFQWRTA